MLKKKKWLIIILILLLLAGIGTAFFGFLMPYSAARGAMVPDGMLVLESRQDGRQLLSWPEGEKADLYRVEILEPAAYGEESELLFREFVEENELLLPPLPNGMTLILRISAGVQFTTAAGEDVRYSENALEIAACLDAPVLSEVESVIDGDEKTVTVRVNTAMEDQWQYQLVDSEGLVLGQEICREKEATLSFAKNGYAMPDLQKSHQLILRARREMPGLLLIGPEKAPVEISWKSLQYRTLDPVLSETGKNTVTITWNATRGGSYEVQLLEVGEDQWKTVASVARDQERSYTSPWLEPESSYCYRVVTMDEQLPGEYLIVSGPLEYSTGSLSVGTTVWPVMDLTVYSGPYGGTVLGTAKCGTAYCVLEERSGAFAVRVGEDIGYINSDYCMINLPEYIGPLCNYNITNSYSSIYMIHEFGIPDVTGVITAGYENIYQTDDTQLVPLLYPTARKLITAAKAAREEGYRLKIYDSFRPYIATRQIFDLTSLIMDLPVPDATYAGKPASAMELPEPGPGKNVLTYGWLMTGTMYGLNSFLAQVTSAHNLGIALDLTLEDLETGEEIMMQSSMHDLSHYSVLPENNEAADTLSRIMLNAGFGGLISEWWHFQDNVSRASLGLPAVNNGVSAECWMKDDTGWRYRTAKGEYYTNETVEIGGRDYVFDENGYALS